MSPADWGPAELAEAYEAGSSLKEIALITGKSFSTVRSRLIAHGVTLRPRTRQPSPDTPSRTEYARERYQNNPEFREKRLAASRKWKANQKTLPS